MRYHCRCTAGRCPPKLELPLITGRRSITRRPLITTSPSNRELIVNGTPKRSVINSLTNRLAMTGLLVIVSHWMCATVVLGSEPVKVIFDTDISGDVDDVLALAMLHTLADRGECDLLAVTISKINPLTGPFVDAVNTFYGRPGVPIGVTRDAQRRDSKYLKLVETRDAGEHRFPHDVRSNGLLPSAVAVLRKTLASQPDHSVVLVQVGLATNLADLLESDPDEHSSQSGRDLVRSKVRLAEVMAGAFVPIRGDDRYLEANVRNGIGSMQRFADQWPDSVPVIWSGFEIGIAATYPRQSIARDFRYTPHHIVAEAYLLHSGPNHDRPTWDLTSVLHAVRPDDDYFRLSQPGRVTIEDDGFAHFDRLNGGRDRFMIMSGGQSLRVREALRYLVSQPPAQDH